MYRLALACVLLAGCSEDLAEVELPACGNLRDGHWDQRFVNPGVSGFSAQVTTIARMPDGSVIAGGRFDAMSGIGARNIARWDGTTWSPLGDGLPDVGSLAVDDKGQLWATGGVSDVLFSGPLIGSGSYLARWDGSEWIVVAQNAFSIYGVTAVDGGIAVFGSFFSQPDLPASGVAILRDGVWSSLGVQAAQVTAATRTPDGLCGVGYVETLNDFMNGVVCWNGSTWSMLGGEPSEIGSATAIARGSDGRMYLGGTLRIDEGETTRYGIARLEDDGEWRALDGGIHARESVAGGGPAFEPYVTSISVDGDGIVVAGHFDWVGVPKRRAYNLARWTPSSGWSAMTPSTDLFGPLSTVLATSEHTYVGGRFSRIGVEPGAGIAAVDGGSVRALPEATLSPARFGTINEMVALPDGIVLAGGFKDSIDGEVDVPTQTLLHFDGGWGRTIEGIPYDSSMTAVALPDGYAIRSGNALYRRFDQQQWHLVTNQPVTGPLVASRGGTLFFVVDTDPSSTIVQTTRDDTSFYALAPGRLVTMTIHDGTLVVVTSNLLGGQSIYRRVDDEWLLIGAWADYTNTLVSSPALGLVAATQGGIRVWNGTDWRTISTASTYDMAACSDGVIAAIDEGDGSRLAFMDDPDGDWTHYGEPRGAQWWRLMPTERGIYVGAAFANEGGVSPDAPLGFARWTTSDDTGW